MLTVAGGREGSSPDCPQSSGRSTVIGTENLNGTLDRGLDTKHGCVCYLQDDGALALLDLLYPNSDSFLP